MIRRPFVSPRGAEHRRPFVRTVLLTRVVDADGARLEGWDGGCRVRVVKDPNRPDGWKIETVVQSAFAATRSPRKPRRGGLQREAALFDDGEADA